jgi:anti-anti-sigma factor
MAEESVSLLLEKHLEMKNVQELAERFAAALAEATRVVLDGSVVSRIDGAGLQLLMAMVHTARQRGVEMAWRQPSATLREAAALLGLEAELDLPEEN